MLELKVGRLLELHERLIIEKGYFERGQHELTKAGIGHIRFEPNDLLKLTRTVIEVEQIARSVGLTNTQQAAATTKEFLCQAPLDAPSFSGLVMQAADCRRMFRHLSDIVSRLRDDCKAHIYLQVAPENAAFYQPTAPQFGEDVQRVFPIAIDDIAGAGRCLALGQGTATVFHLMRVMEAGLRGLAAELGVPYAPSWESYITKLERILNPKNYANLTDQQKAKRPFYQDVLGDLSAVKLVWRHRTMHIVKSYDIDRAKMIYGAVESFLKHLAEKLDPIPPVVISTGPTS